MASDKEIQAEEVTDLFNHFGDDIVCDYPGDLISGQLKIRIKLPDLFFVKAEVDDERKQVFGVGIWDRYFIEHLPPITLHFTLPKTYPSQTKPSVILSCTWLHRRALSVLCAKLDKLWEEHQGMRILHIWTEELRTKTLEVLGIPNQFNVAWVHQPVHMQSTTDNFYVIAQTPSRSPSPTLNVVARTPSSAESENSADKEIDVVTSTTRDTPECVSPQGSDLQEGMLDQPKENGLDLVEVELDLDPRAVSDAIPTKDGKAVSLMHHLLEYNEEQAMNEVFMTSYQLCEECFRPLMGRDCVRLQCSNTFCNECVTSDFAAKIQGGKDIPVTCPSPDCQFSPSPQVVKKLVSEEMFQRYEEILMRRAKERMHRSFVCPRSKCQHAMLCDPCVSLVTCSGCCGTFCKYCKTPEHGDDPCPLTEHALKIFYETIRRLMEGPEADENVRGDFTEEENLFFRQWAVTRTQPCPRCRVSTQQFEDCNKVLCSKCNTYFCWICLEELEPDNPYFHFNNPDSKCCLFGDAEVVVEEEEEEEEQIMLALNDTDSSDEDDEDDVEGLQGVEIGDDDVFYGPEVVVHDPSADF